MSQFIAYDDAGRGFNMPASAASGYVLGEADPNVTAYLVFDNGSTAIFDVYGSPIADEYEMHYSVSGNIIYIDDIIYSKGNWITLEFLDLNLYGSISDLANGTIFSIELGTGNDLWSGNNYPDVIHGGPGNDIVEGYGAGDVLFGDAGRDRVYGDGGSDVVSGGLGKDKLWGGPGKDGFLFDSALGGGNVDKIKDFNPKKDLVALDNAIFSSVGAKLSKKDSKLERSLMIRMTLLFTIKIKERFIMLTKEIMEGKFSLPRSTRELISTTTISL